MSNPHEVDTTAELHDQMCSELRELKTRISASLDILFEYGQAESSHHKAWVIDQVVRLLHSPPEYLEFVKNHNAGRYGPDTYEWDEGTPP